MAAWRATAPTTLGEPASSRSGGVGPDDLVEVDQVDRPAPGQERVAGLEERSAARSRAPAPNGAYSLWPLKATKSAVGGEGAVGGELGGVHHDRHPPLRGRRR